MRFPRERIRLETKADGSGSEVHYVVLDLKGLDIEGAVRLEVLMADIDSVKTAAGKQEAERERVRNLLGD